ncbi:hypothetical protein BV898_09900 [Hypsibius exemplaris]|uniref:Uncharacterized protein n=1 Tax=Hypsibius exemplaris TaxID=2072580 RepID=A0A1W0WLC3_HYPEX|nr:hypothetical protein BV898_09900 [Hypsibius exemplaris]
MEPIPDEDPLLPLLPLFNNAPAAAASKALDPPDEPPLLPPPVRVLMAELTRPLLPLLLFEFPLPPSLEDSALRRSVCARSQTIG